MRRRMPLPPKVSPPRPLKQQTHVVIAYTCVGGPLNGIVQMVRRKIDDANNSFRMKADRRAAEKGMKGFYRATIDRRLTWVEQE